MKQIKVESQTFISNDIKYHTQVQSSLKYNATLSSKNWKLASLYLEIPCLPSFLYICPPLVGSWENPINYFIAKLNSACMPLSENSDIICFHRVCNFLLLPFGTELNELPNLMGSSIKISNYLIKAI